MSDRENSLKNKLLCAYLMAPRKELPLICVAMKSLIIVSPGEGRVRGYMGPERSCGGGLVGEDPRNSWNFTILELPFFISFDELNEQ